MATRRELTVRTARNKGRTAIALGVGTLIIGAVLMKIALLLGIIAFVAGGAFTASKVREWLAFRGENGLYF